MSRRTSGQFLWKEETVMAVGKPPLGVELAVTIADKGQHGRVHQVGVQGWSQGKAGGVGAIHEIGERLGAELPMHVPFLVERGASV